MGRGTRVERRIPAFNTLVVAPVHEPQDGCLHVHVVAGQVERDQDLEQHGIVGVGGTQMDEQTGGGAAIRDHVQDGAKLCRLVEAAGRIAIEGIEDTGQRVENSAVVGVVRHKVERSSSEHHARVS